MAQSNLQGSQIQDVELNEAGYQEVPNKEASAHEIMNPETFNKINNTGNEEEGFSTVFVSDKTAEVSSTATRLMATADDLDELDLPTQSSRNEGLGVSIEISQSEVPDSEGIDSDSYASSPTRFEAVNMPPLSRTSVKEMPDMKIDPISVEAVPQLLNYGTTSFNKKADLMILNDENSTDEPNIVVVKDALPIGNCIIVDCAGSNEAESIPDSIFSGEECSSPIKPESVDFIGDQMKTKSLLPILGAVSTPVQSYTTSTPAITSSSLASMPSTPRVIDPNWKKVSDESITSSNPRLQSSARQLSILDSKSSPFTPEASMIETSRLGTHKLGDENIEHQESTSIEDFKSPSRWSKSLSNTPIASKISNHSLRGSQSEPHDKEILRVELRTMKIASLQTRNTALSAEIAARQQKLEELKRGLRFPAKDTVKKHIKLLHDYNDIKDIGQGLLGMIAENRGLRISDMYEEFGIGLKD